MKDIPLAEMTRAAMATQMTRRQQHRFSEPTQNPPQQAQDTPSDEESGQLYTDWDLIDVTFLSTIFGRDISYDELGMIPAEFSTYPRTAFPHGSFTNKDLETYQQLSDLFWWYCKMDNYQSILGGTKLL